MIWAAEKFWILDPLYAALGSMLAWFYGVLPSFGVAIILLTISVSILRMPLVAKYLKSQQAMQRVQPEIKRIQAKYKDDPQKRNEELMRVYKEEKVNPLAGCLPMLLQMPLFIVLYRLILDLGRPAPKHIPVDSALFAALRESGGRMKSFGMDLSQKASDVSGLGTLLPYALIIGLVVGTGMFQQRQMTSRLPKDSMTAQLQIMGKIFPVFLGVISLSIPAGVVLYFLVGNIWQIGQQAFVFRRQAAREAAAGDKDAPAKADSQDKSDKSGKSDKAAGRGGKGTAGATGAKATKGGGDKAARAKQAAASGGRGKASAAQGNGRRARNAAASAAAKAQRNGKGDRRSPASTNKTSGSGAKSSPGRITPKGTAGSRSKSRGNSRKGK